MDKELNKIKDYFEDERKSSNTSIPEFGKMKSRLGWQNFIKFSFYHFNILYATAILAIGGGSTYLAINSSQTTTEHEREKEKTEISNPPSETKTEFVPATEEKENTETKKTATEKSSIPQKEILDDKQEEKQKVTINTCAKIKSDSAISKADEKSDIIPDTTSNEEKKIIRKVIYKKTRDTVFNYDTVKITKE
jgi:hypothetical protein